MTTSIDHLHAVKLDVVANDQALSRVAPVTHAHVNSLGRYELDRQPPPARSTSTAFLCRRSGIPPNLATSRFLPSLR